MYPDMTIEELFKFKEEHSFFSPEGRQIIKNTSIEVLKEAILNKSIHRIFTALVRFPINDELKKKLQKVFTDN